MSTKKWLKIYGVAFIIYFVYAFSYRQSHFGDPDVLVEYYFGVFGHILFVWYLIPRGIYRIFMKMIGKPVIIADDKPVTLTDEEIIDRWVNAA